MECVHNLANLYRVSPFEVLNSDVEHFIMCLNYLIARGSTEKPQKVMKHDPFWNVL